VEYQKKDFPGVMGRVKLDLVDRKGHNYVIMMPDPNQSPEGIMVAKNFVNNTFLKDSAFKIGMTSFPEDEWKKSQGKAQEFINAIKRSKVTISWTDGSKDKKIMKGLEALLPKVGAQPGGMPGEMGGMDLSQGLANSLKGGGGGGSFGPMISSPSAAMPSSISGLTGGTPSPSNGPMGSPAPTAKPETFTVDSMKILLEMWEKVKNAI
jgi:hypothetical protein